MAQTSQYHHVMTYISLISKTTMSFRRRDLTYVHTIHVLTVLNTQSQLFLRFLHPSDFLRGFLRQPAWRLSINVDTLNVGKLWIFTWQVVEFLINQIKWGSLYIFYVGI